MRGVLLVVLGILAGCVYHRVAVFNEAEFVTCEGEGEGAIVGQAFLKTMGGDVKYGAGNVVYLYPATAYTREWFQHDAVNIEAVLPDPDPRLTIHRRSTIADGEGRFEFENLPPCGYFAISEVYWHVPGGFFAEGGKVWAPVQVASGKRVKVVLTR